jgi:hypothetical protein
VTLRCLHCGDAIHLSCQHKLYKDACKEPLKNRIKWLAELIQFSSLEYRCKACVKKNETVPLISTNVQVAKDPASMDLENVKQSIAELSTQIRVNAQ